MGFSEGSGSKERGEQFENVGADRMYALGLRVRYSGTFDKANDEGSLFDKMQLSPRDREIARIVFYNKDGSPRVDILDFTPTAFQELWRLKEDKYKTMTVDDVKDFIVKYLFNYGIVI